MCPANVPPPKNDCTPVVNVADDVSNASESAPEVPPPLKPLPAVTPVMSAVVLNTPFVAVKFVPAIAETKSAIASFLLELSPASIIAKLSFATSIVAAVNSLRSSASETVPLVPPPLKPSPAVTPSISAVILRTPFVAVIPDPAIAVAKSANDSFLLPLSVASINAILSFATSTATAVNSFRSKSSVALPLAAPPLNPFPATIAVISPVAADCTSANVASLCPPCVDPSCTITVLLVVSIVISPASPVNDECWVAVPRLL